MKRKITCVLLLAYAMLSSTVLIAQTRGVTITGNCFLEQETDHSGIKVLFTAVTPSAVTGTVYSASDGSFTIGLAVGIYTVSYSKNDYLPYTIPGTVTFFANTTLNDVTLLSGQYNISGIQNGVWKAKKTYRIISDVIVNIGDTLWIQPGVEVKFMENYKFDVYGTLLAVGNESDSIVFTSGKQVPSSNDWQWIHFIGNAASGSVLSYAIVQFGNYGVFCENSSTPIITNSSFRNNFYGIYCKYSSPIVQDNSCNNNSYGIICDNASSHIQNNICNYNSYGIICNYYSSPTIQNNICNNNNAYGINCSSTSPTIIIQNNTCDNNLVGIFCTSPSPTIKNNICNNNYNGIDCHSSSPTIQNNTICQNNNCGIYCDGNSNPEIFNNIVAGNKYGVSLWNLPQNLTFNLFWENENLYEGNAVPATFGQIVTQNANIDSCDTYFNLFMDPEYVFNGQITFEACTNLVGDENPENDCIIKTVNNSFWTMTSPDSKTHVLEIFGTDDEIYSMQPEDHLTKDFNNQYVEIAPVLDRTFSEMSHIPGVVGVKSIANTNNVDPKVSFASTNPSRSVLYDNGPLITHPGGGAGGNDASVLQSTSGPLLGVRGFAAQQTAGNSMADDFVVTGTCILTSLKFYAYQTGSTTTSTITGIYVQIWNGAPNAGGTVVWGDLTTNRLASTTWSTIYRSIETNLLESDRPIMEVVANVAGCVLNTGTYWVQYQMTGSLASGPWAPPISIWGAGLTGNALQLTSTGWAAAVSGTAPNTYGQGMPFIVEGTSGGSLPNNDISVISILSPSTGANLGSAEPVTIRISNYGINSQSNIPYEVTWIGSIQSGSYSGIYEETLNSGDYVDITLPVTVDFAIPNDYHLMPTSPCIDAGNPDTAYYDPDGTIADIGAFYFDQGSAAPVINDFTATPATGRMPLVVQFSQDITGPVTAYQWVFGDGSTSTLPNPVHVYNAMGYYTVSLMASGPGGSDILVKTDYIHVLAPVPPLNAAFTGIPLLGYAPLEVQFTNQSTGPWQTLLWDFGDGSTSAELNPLHVYAQPGDYSVSLTLFVTSSEKTELKQNYIHAIAPQEVVAMFGVSGNHGAAPYTVAFFDQSFGSVDSLRWDFGDGAISILANPTHVYQLPGEYTATLTVYGPLNTGTAGETILAESVAPVITQITDRPGDQGGYVYVKFKKSFYDNVVPGKSTESYTIQRQDNGHWVSVNTTLAYGEAVYTVEVTTLSDSVAGNNGLSGFRVIAGMDEGTWISEPVQGYSVDNIAPSPPDGMDWVIAGSQLEFSWNPCPDQDFRYFAVYKSDETGLFPDTPVATLTGTSFSTEVAPEEGFIYAVTSFDHSGNESLFSEEISNLDRQEILIPQGWSGISGYLEPYNSEIGNIFAPIAGNLTILMNETGMYWPGQNVNTLGTWQISRGYQIKMENQADFSMRGYKLTEHSLSLASGWSLIPVLSENNADVAALFAGTGLELVKEVAGFRLYWPAYGISTLSSLEPGKAYQVLMNTPGTIVFPAEPMKNSAANQPPFVNTTPWNEITATPFTHVIAFGKEACRVFKTGDIIAAFTAYGLCAGIQPYHSGALGLVAFGDDGMTAERDGFLQGEALDFKMFRPTTGEQFNLEVSFDNHMNTGDFAENGVSVVTLVKMSPLTPGTIMQDEISIFPNPSHGIFSLTGLETQASIGIFNSFGSAVTNLRITLPGEIDLSDQPKGVYFLQIKTGEGIFIKKLVLN